MKRFIVLTCLGIFFCLTPQKINAQSPCRKLDSLQRMLLIVKADSALIDTYNALAVANAETNNKGYASLYAEKALRMAEDKKYQKGVADALVHIAYFSDKGIEEFANTIRKYQKALNIYRELGLKDKVISILEIIGTFYYKLGNFENYRKAMTYYEEALKVRKENPKIGSKLALADTYERIGELATYLQEDDKALKNLREAQQIKEGLGIKQIQNARLLAKYQRMKDLQGNVQDTSTVQMAVGFSIVIAILLTLLIINIVRKNEAVRELRTLGIEFPKKEPKKLSKYAN
ncbi:MAG: tetratricopeptide repeat protein [Cytophagales bacterium]|nr:MAG: tetratricopeptide repeat protein [Cytophagales bacterium]